MKHEYLPTPPSIARMALAGLLSASTLLLAQDQTVTPVAPADTAQQNSAPTVADSNGGWKRVGSQAQVYTPPPAAPQNDQDPNAQQPPPPYPGPQVSSAPQGPYPSSAQPAYPSANQQPNYPPPPPVPAQLTIPGGTYLTVRVNQMLSSDKNQPGDSFTASLTQPVVVNGVVVAEPGQTLGGHIVSATKHKFDQPARLGLALNNLTLVDGQQLPVTTQFVSRQGGSTPGGVQAGTVAATTGAGATIGAIAGWGTGAAIGAGAGAAAGLIGVLVTRNHASVVYPEQILTFKLEAPLTFSTANSSQAFRYVQPNEYDRPTYASGPGNGAYESAAPPPPVYNTYSYGYPYPYYNAWGWGYPYYWGPSVAVYGGYWGGRYYPRGGYWGGGRYYGPRGYVGGGYRGPVGGGRPAPAPRMGGMHR
jgi:hypothetical protein